MLSLAALTTFNMLVLLSPPQAILDLLTLMILPKEARVKLLMAIAINMAASILYEEYGALVVSGMVGHIIKWRKKSHLKVREADGKIYKSVEGGMR